MEKAGHASILRGSTQEKTLRLSTRLKELREAGLIDHAGQEYCLTEAGVALRLALRPLSDWAEAW